MPRYEFNEGKSSKFWEIELDGESFTTKFGRIGASGQESTKDFDSRGEAKREYDKLVAEKVKKGYALVSAGGGDAPPAAKSNPALEDAIRANPDDVHAYEVYGDWLQANGDARGELVAVQIGLASKQDPKLAERETELLSSLSEHLHEPDLASMLGEAVRITWRNGFYDTVRISLGYDDADEADIDGLVKAVLGHPSGRFLRGLTIGMFDYEGENHYPRITKLLKAAGPVPTLKSLFLGDFEYPDETEMSWANVGDIGKLWELYPNLEELTLQGAEIGLGKIVAPKLRSLLLRTGGLPRGVFKSLASAEFPSLERLVVWTGSEGYGADSKLKDLAPLLAGANLPALKHLGVANSELAGEVLKALPKSKLLGRLESLDLSMGTLNDEEAEPFFSNTEAFRHLQKIDLAENTLSSETVDRLAKLGLSISAGSQRENDPEYRYTAVGE